MNEVPLNRLRHYALKDLLANMDTNRASGGTGPSECEDRVQDLLL